LADVHIQLNDLWPTFKPDSSNAFSVITNIGSHDWELTYFERFGGL